MVTPSCRREMAHQTVDSRGISIRLACLAFGISQTCYRYQAKLSAENVEIADHLIRLTHNQRNWGFGLCFLYLRNVKGYSNRLVRCRIMRLTGCGLTITNAPTWRSVALPRNRS